MINERALEFLCLNTIIDSVNESFPDKETVFFEVNGKIVDYQAILDRHEEIFNEIIEPYVIDTPSNED